MTYMLFSTDLNEKRNYIYSLKGTTNIRVIISLSIYIHRYTYILLRADSHELNVFSRNKVQRTYYRKP